MAAAALGASCSRAESPPVGVGGAMGDTAEMILYKSRFAITDRGMRRAEVEGDSTYFFNDNTRMVILPLRTRFFNSSGVLEGIVTAREGTYDTRLATLEARGDVVMTAIDGKKIETPFARFDQRLNQMSTDSSFVLSEPDREVRGIGFVSDADLSTVRVMKMISTKSMRVAIPQ